jgi:hypothetical protein
MLSSLQQMEHFVCTIYGNSNCSYDTSTWDTPIVDGIGQGNRASSQAWALMSMQLLNLLREKGHGFFNTSAISGEKLAFAGYTFMDDDDAVINQPEEPPEGFDIVYKCMPAEPLVGFDIVQLQQKKRFSYSLDS